MTVDLQDLFPSIKGMDEKSIYALLRALKNNFDPNIFDYFKFKQSLLAMSKLSMDSDTSYKSAFATASTMGLTKEKLVDSARKYISVLDNERESFATALLARKKQKIDGRKEEVVGLEKKIEEYKTRILELQREIEIFQERIDTVDQDVDAATIQIEGTKNNFLSVYNTLAKAINDDIDSITNYL